MAIYMCKARPGEEGKYYCVGTELEGGLTEWIIGLDGNIYHWGIQLENLYCRSIEFTSSTSGAPYCRFEMEMEVNVGSVLDRRPMVLDASRSDTVERLMARCLQLEAELEKAKAK